MSQPQAKRLKVTVEEAPASDEDVSSAEEELARREQKLADSHFVPKAATVADMDQDDDQDDDDDIFVAHAKEPVDSEAAQLDAAFAHAVRPGLDDVPSILDMRDLVKMYPHLREGSDCRLAHAKRCSQSQAGNQAGDDNASSSLGEHDATPDQHARMASVVPAEEADFLQKRQALPLHRFYVEGEAQSELTQEQLEAQLRDDRLQLPYMSASHESLLLGQAGRFVDTDGVSRHFPACCRQSQCVASTQRIEHLSEPIVLTSLMYPSEYRRFLKHGQVPSAPRPCVLCCRQVLADWNMTCRVQLMLGRAAGVRADANHPWQYRATQVRQMYRNSVDCEGGYHSRYCVLPQPHEPLVQPMARLSRLWLRAFKSRDSGRWHIDQSALVWRARPVPPHRTGETIESF